MTPDIEAGRQERKARLFKALKSISTLESLPEGRVEQLPAIKELLNATDEVARFSELDAMVDEIWELSDRYPEEANSLVLYSVTKRFDDRFILGHGDPDLTLVRIDVAGSLPVELPELGVNLTLADDTAYFEMLNSHEVTQCVIESEVQIIVRGEEEVISGFERQVDELEQRWARDAHGLHGSAKRLFDIGDGIGFGMRAAWGSGTIALTNTRIVGVLVNDTPHKAPPSGVSFFTPTVTFSGDYSSLIAFSLPLSALEEVEAIDMGFLANRTPVAQIVGKQVTLALESYAIFEGGRRTRLRKRHHLFETFRDLDPSRQGGPPPGS